MTKQQRNGTQDRALLMYEMYLERIKSIALNRDLEMRQIIQLALDLAPVKLVLPGRHEAPDVAQRRAYIPPYFI